jgi:hypothetical protein
MIALMFRDLIFIPVWLLNVSKVYMVGLAVLTFGPGGFGPPA